MTRIIQFVLTITLILTTQSNVAAQGVQQGKKVNEVRIDLLAGILNSNLEVSYERILSSYHSVGASSKLYFLRGQVYGYSLDPYYRNYFSKKKSEGFFVEGCVFTIFIPNLPTVFGNKFGLGLAGSTGYKFVNKNVWQVDLNLRLVQYSIIDLAPNNLAAIREPHSSLYNFISNLDLVVGFGKRF